jgi:hypothetical protein
MIVDRHNSVAASGPTIRGDEKAWLQRQPPQAGAVDRD